MSGTDPTTPQPTESGAPGTQPSAPPAPVPPRRSPASAVHVAGPEQAAPDDAPTSLMPALTAPAATYDSTDATRVAAPLQQRPTPTSVDVPVGQRNQPPVTSQPAPGPQAGSAPTRTPSYATRQALGTPPGGPYGGLYGGPMAVPAGVTTSAPAQQDPQATQVAGQAPVPPPPAPPVAVPPVAVPSVARPVAVPAPRTAAPPRTPARGGAAHVLGRVEPRVAVLSGIVGVLVVVAVVLGFTLFGGSDAPAGTPSAGKSASAGTGAQPVVTERFASPSRNIACTMSAGEATCSIANLAEKPAPVDGCDGTIGYVAKVAADGTVTTPCVAHRDKPHAAAKSTHVLGYGESVTVGKLRCTSAETGVRCVDKATGRGFTIARAGIGGV